MENKLKKYYLGSNSAEGFVSYFSDCYSVDEGWRAYIIKGGPGTGKSSFMKYVAQKADEKGFDIEIFPCSSDPQSLDAIIIRGIKTVILDGTAPHVVEPEYPGICEQILNFGQFLDVKKLQENIPDILSITRKNKNLHRMASRYLLAAGQIMLDTFNISSLSTYSIKAAEYALKLSKSKIPCKGGDGKEWLRFIEAVTPLGIVSYSDTITGFYENIVIISDKYFSCANVIMNVIRNYAIKAGYEIITVKNPFLPGEITDHILIPELNLAFVTENDYIHFNTDARRIHSRRFTDTKKLCSSKQRIQFNNKAVRQLILSAAATIAEAKTVHDQIEKYYVEAMDFEAQVKFAADFTEKLLQ